MIVRLVDELCCCASLSFTAGGDSAGGNLTICALEYMRQRAAGSVDPALPAAAPALAGTGSANKHSNSSSSAAAVPFHPPVAALLVSPAVDLSGSSVFGRPAAQVAEIFRYDYVVKSEGDADSSGAQCFPYIGLLWGWAWQPRFSCIHSI
jgi:acetyl esterase/lipase